MVEKGLLVVNKKNVFKVTGPEEDAFKWTSKYGSVSFNMYGCGLPMGGVNEAGLVIDNMWLAETAYPEPDSRLELSEVQWIQYQLDTAATVGEVIASDSKIRIGGANGVALHFLLCDRKGGCATVEFLDGKMIYHTDEDLPITALTNSVYDNSLDYLESWAGEDTSAAYREMSNSLGRFITASERLKAFNPKTSGSAVDYAFATLDSVSNAGTQWSIVYDPGNARVYFRTRSNREIRYVDIKTLDYSCDSPVKILDMLTGGPGDVSDSLVDYSYDVNYAIIENAFSKTPFLKDVPVEALQSIARYPETMRCVK
jgi:choloylglycine hydrolase